MELEIIGEATKKITREFIARNSRIEWENREYER